jgi:hypothetical protein
MFQSQLTAFCKSEAVSSKGGKLGLILDIALQAAGITAAWLHRPSWRITYTRV